jgi:hypothetical protein
VEYVAMLRASRVLKWYAIVLAALEVLVFVAIFHDGPPNIGDGPTINGSHSGIPFDALLLGGLLGPLVVSSFLAAGLDGEYRTAAIAWTRPITRLAIAGRYLIVDAIALLAAWALTLVACLIPLAAVGALKFITFTPQMGAGSFLLGAGVAVMWYGLVVIVAALLPGRGGAVAGWSWGVFLILPGLMHAPFPDLIHAIVVGLNFLDPFAYLGNIGSDSNVLGLQPVLRKALPWAIGILTVVAGTQLWAKREVAA